MLRHTVATLAYRAAKVLRDAPPGFENFRAAPTTRTAEQILAHLATAQGCMGRIRDNLPLNDVVTKGKALGKAIRLIDQLNSTLDMERGQKIAENLRSLYVYMLARLTLASSRQLPVPRLPARSVSIGNRR